MNEFIIILIILFLTIGIGIVIERYLNPRKSKREIFSPYKWETKISIGTDRIEVTTYVWKYHDIIASVRPVYPLTITKEVIIKDSKEFAENIINIHKSLT